MPERMPEQPPLTIEFYACGPQLFEGMGFRYQMVDYCEFPRDLNGACAFCHGDPCDESDRADTLIHDFYLVDRSATTCLVCDGRPT